MEEAKTFIDKDYRAERYRSLYSLYGDPAFCVGPLIPCMLEKDPSFLPPADVEGKSGRPKKGPRKRARLRRSTTSTSMSCTIHTKERRLPLRLLPLVREVL